VQRIGLAVAEYGLPFPPLCDDPGELWLVAEALMARYHQMRSRHEREQQARESARVQARDLIQQYRRGEEF
jgi:hypothetical protein